MPQRAHPQHLRPAGIGQLGLGTGKSFTLDAAHCVCYIRFVYCLLYSTKVNKIAQIANKNGCFLSIFLGFALVGLPPSYPGIPLLREGFLRERLNTRFAVRLLKNFLQEILGAGRAASALKIHPLKRGKKGLQPHF